MRLGIVHNTDRPSARRRARRIVAGGVAMAAGSVAFTAAQAQVGSAAPAREPAVTVPAPRPPVPPTVPPETTTTTAAALEMTTTTTVPPEPASTTTTTTAGPPTPPATAPPARVPANAVSPARRAPEPTRQQQVETIADSTGWDWRASGVRIVVAFHPEDCCHWGVYDSRSRTLYIGPTAFGDAARLRYVVLHELGHAWQYQTGRFRELIADYERFGMTTPATALEAGGDCIAAIWGATEQHYWTCPGEAKATAARRLAGDWR